MANTISAAEALAVINRPGTDSERGVARMSIAGKMVEVYDLQGAKVEVRAENLDQYLGKGFTVDAPAPTDPELTPLKITRARKGKEHTAEPPPAPPPPPAPITSKVGTDEGNEDNP